MRLQRAAFYGERPLHRLMTVVLVVGFGAGLARPVLAQFQFPSSNIGDRRPIHRPAPPKPPSHNLAERDQASNRPAGSSAPPPANTAPDASKAGSDAGSSKSTDDALLPAASLLGVGSDGSLAQLLRSLALANAPKRYVNDKQWGQQKWVWRGVKVSLDGLRVDSEPRWKLANHGTWKRYEIELADRPEALQLEINNMRQNADDGHLQFDVVCLADLDLEGRFAQWERGVQLISVGTAADAKLRVAASCDVAVQLDPLKLPPDVILKPQVTAARIELVDFHLRKVGDFDGPVVRELGRGLRDMLEDRIADESPKLATKLNRQIEKQQDKLRLSAFKRDKK